MWRADVQINGLFYRGQDCPEAVARNLIKEYKVFESRLQQAIDAACTKSSSFTRFASESALKSDL